MDTRKVSRALAPALACFLTIGCPRGARADLAGAEALFRQGRALLSEGKIGAACEKFAASQRMDPSAGTLLNLADCHAREGKTASAWAEFLTAVRAAKNQGDEARSNEAARRAKELEPGLSHVVIKVATHPPGLRIQRDELVLEEAALSSPIPVDPGPHLVTAHAPGRKAWSQSIRVGTQGDTVEVVVPALDVEEAATTTARTTSDAAPANRAPTAGYIVAGSGLVAAGVGAWFGWQALATYRDAENDCQGRHTSCPASSTTKYDTARTQATVANVGIGVGVGALAVGAYLLLFSGASARTSSAGAAVVPWLDVPGRAGAGVDLAGRF